jgi:hypothetical protein
MEAEISIEGLFETKYADFGLLGKGELCHALLDGIIPFLPLLYNTKLPTLFKAPLDEEFGTVKINIEQFWHIVWHHVCYKINNL